MAWLRRGSRDESGRVGRGEHVMAVAPVGSAAGPVVAGEAVTVTDRALYLPDSLGFGRIPWDLVQRATWEEPVLEVTLQSAPGSAASTVRLDLPAPGAVPPAVHDRVESSVVITRHVPLQGKLGANVVARRVSDTGALRWSVTFDAGLNARDPALRARTDAAVAELRETLGV